jgi:hypothetical protein
VLFFFFLNGHSQILVVIIFGCFFCFNFLVLEDAHRVFDKMFKPNMHALFWSISSLLRMGVWEVLCAFFFLSQRPFTDSCCDNFWLFFFVFIF